jgi:hypothetical protein
VHFEPSASHVYPKVGALGIQGEAHLEHFGRQLDERHLEELLEMGGVVAAAATELQHRLRVARRTQERRIERCLFRVGAGWRHQRPPRGELGIELR